MTAQPAESTVTLDALDWEPRCENIPERGECYAIATHAAYKSCGCVRLYCLPHAEEAKDRCMKAPSKVIFCVQCKKHPIEILRIERLPL